jgi:hypothetical protein
MAERFFGVEQARGQLGRLGDDVAGGSDEISLTKRAGRSHRCRVRPWGVAASCAATWPPACSVGYIPQGLAVRERDQPVVGRRVDPACVEVLTAVSRGEVPAGRRPH